ncbi:MAG: carbonic anhydrase [Flavobacteriia bacterium]|nr:carbonic anhydrase [Flavobacteriia bacterium]
MSQTLDALLEGNSQYIKKINESFPELFEAMGKGQSPEVLWIGCADSRVPVNQLTDSKPGTIFVHRNIANVVVHTDMNLLSVVFYAVKVLKVKHVVICGHYGCGGVAAALSGASHGIIDTWLNHIKDIYRLHKDEVDQYSGEERNRKMVEINVKEQVQNMARIPFLQDSWKEGEGPSIHGWAYDVGTGELSVLDSIVKGQNDLAEMYQLK